MDCTTARELLPWLLNGTLDPPERHALEDHLANCRHCRAELDDVTEVWELVASHPPPALLVAWAEHEDIANAKAIAEHVAQCVSCAVEVALIQQSKNLDTFVTPRVAAPHGAAAVRRWRLIALAAIVVACLCLGALVASRFGAPGLPQLVEGDGTAQQQELTAATAKLEALAAEVERLSTLAAELSLPRPNLPVVELLPDSFTLRGGEVSPTIVPPASTVTVILATRTEDAWDGYRLRLIRADGSEIWRTEDITRNDTDDFTLLLPTATLEPGILSLHLDGRRGQRWSELETYSLRVPESGDGS